jgi:glycosyltransferase involved in cell wall biosynthesis
MPYRLSTAIDDHEASVIPTGSRPPGDQLIGERVIVGRKFIRQKSGLRRKGCCHTGVFANALQRQAGTVPFTTFVSGSISAGRIEAKGWLRAVSSVKPPVRIAFCITDLDPGGAERALVQLVTGLDRGRWEPAVFCLARHGALADELEATGTQVACLGARNWSSIWVILRLARELRRFQPAIVQTFLFHANIAGRIAARFAGVGKVVAGIRVAEKRSRVPLWLDRWTNRLVATNVCVSQAVADFSIGEAGLAPEKIVVIGNGVDVKRFSDARPADLRRFRIPEASPVLLTIGRLDRQKGLTDLIEAAALVAPRFPAAHFLLVGEGPERSAIERLIGEKGLAERMHLAGWRPDVPELLAAGFGIVLSSHWEGMPNVVLEAMAAELPVVATRVEGTSELVEDGQTGLLVAIESPQALAEAIGRLLADPASAKALGVAGRERVTAHFSWEQMIARYESLYESLV